jgi:DNA-binding HxlR family transcriptional regulator
MGRAVRLVGDVWILLIMISLQRGPQRFGELQEQIGHISSRTLTQRLRLLEALGFVERRAFLEIPPRVEYHLTAKGQEFGQVITAIETFARRNLSDPLPSTSCQEFCLPPASGSATEVEPEISTLCGSSELSQEA